MKAFVAMSAALALGALGVGLVLGQTVSPAPAQDAFHVPVAVPAGASPSASVRYAQTFSEGTNAATAAAAAAVLVQSPPFPAATPAASTPPAEGAMAAPAAVATSGHRFPAYTNCDVDGPYIAITFDDGPNPETTPKLLKMLEARGIKATFFVVGTRASENPEMLRRMVAAGHEIGNHSWSHPQLPKVSVAEADRQIADTSAAIHNAIGKDPQYLRPPYGAMTPGLRKHIEDKFGLAMVYWSADSLDWKNRDSQSIYDKVMAQTRPGGIILMHDIHATTVAAVPRVLDALLAKGYKFVTVSELIAMHKPPAAKSVATLAPATVKKPKPQTAKPVALKPATGSGAAAARPANAVKPKPAMPAPGSASLF